MNNARPFVDRVPDADEHAGHPEAAGLQPVPNTIASFSRPCARCAPAALRSCRGHARACRRWRGPRRLGKRRRSLLVRVYWPSSRSFCICPRDPGRWACRAEPAGRASSGARPNFPFGLRGIAGWYLSAEFVGITFNRSVVRSACRFDAERVPTLIKAALSITQRMCALNPAGACAVFQVHWPWRCSIITSLIRSTISCSIGLSGPRRGFTTERHHLTDGLCTRRRAPGTPALYGPQERLIQRLAFGDLPPDQTRSPTQILRLLPLLHGTGRYRRA